MIASTAPANWPAVAWRSWRRRRRRCRPPGCDEFRQRLLTLAAELAVIRPSMAPIGNLLRRWQRADRHRQRDLELLRRLAAEHAGGADRSVAPSRDRLRRPRGPVVRSWSYLDDPQSQLDGCSKPVACSGTRTCE